MYDWIEVKLPETEIEDFLWEAYDYLWVKTNRGLYLSRDQGESFNKVGTFTFVFKNIWHIVRRRLNK